MKALSFFVHRPVTSSLLALAISLPGIVAFFHLPIASLPEVDYPAISVSASLPGASPETMAATVATPLERILGRIAGVTEMTSTSTQGSTRISLQFDLSRDVDSVAREVQSAIHGASHLLPAALPTLPTYRKANSAAGPVLAIALTSPTRTQDQLYDIAFTHIAQRISRVPGVGQVTVNGSSVRSVRVEVDPRLLAQRNLSLEQVRTALASAATDAPKGFIETAETRYQLHVPARHARARDYEDLIVHASPAGVVRLRDVASIRDSVQELRSGGSSGGKPAVMLAVVNQPGANVVETVDAVKALLPRLASVVPHDVDVRVVVDRSTTIRRSLREVEETLLLSVTLVVAVTFLFLRSGRATLIPTVAIPVSLLGTLAVIYLCGFSLNNLSLMALIIATGFVVDDAIVVLENAVHHLERGLSPREAALRAVRSVGFTVLAMSVSLVAVFIPLLFMSGIIGRLFREFAITLSVSVALSMVVSLTITPMLCARLLGREGASQTEPSRFRRALDAAVRAPARVYAQSLTWALAHPATMLLVFAASVALSVTLYTTIPKGFFPLQDTGRLQGFFRADQSISFRAMRDKVNALMRIVGSDPDILTYYEYGGGAAGNQLNTGSMFAQLRPRSERSESADEIVKRLRPKLARVPGATLVLRAQQDVNIGARQGGAQFQYTLLSSDLRALERLAPRFRGILAKLPELTDVTSDFQDRGLEARVVVDRDAAARLGVRARDIDATLNDAFGQRIVSTQYEPLNQYYTVLALKPEFALGPEALGLVHVAGKDGQRIPLMSLARVETRHAPLAVNHDGQLNAATFSFNLAEGVSLEQAAKAIEDALARANPDGSVRGSFAGTMQAFLASLRDQPWLIGAALLAVYVVMGMLYESLLHPLTILSTLPSAGVGALLALLAVGENFTIIALIGVILLIGIVKKNAIMMIDCALELERNEGLAPEASIHRACLERFRPILMTTLSALLGAVPLALGAGDGAELRRPLGITIVGGLALSQVLTLYTTPVVYLCLSRLSASLRRRPRVSLA